MRRLKPFINCFFAIILAASLVGVTHKSRAQTKSKEDAVKKLLQDRNRQIKAIVGPKGTPHNKKKRQKLKKVINDAIDYKAMSKYALGDTWKKISSQKRKEFVDLFSTIVSDHSLNNLDIYRARIRFLDISVNGNDAAAKTLATEKDIRKHVSYKLHFKPSQKKWVVTDFSINDVSTAKSYRRQFQDIIHKHGFDNLMDTLRKRANRKS